MYGLPTSRRHFRSPFYLPRNTISNIVFTTAPFPVIIVVGFAQFHQHRIQFRHFRSVTIRPGKLTPVWSFECLPTLLLTFAYVMSFAGVALLVTVIMMMMMMMLMMMLMMMKMSMKMLLMMMASDAFLFPRVRVCVVCMHV